LAIPHITVCICAFKRPELLRKLLRELAGQETDSLFTYSVVVADNDREQSARPVVAEVTAKTGLQIIYCVQTVQNIALTRNAALAKASGEFIAFIDDDEFPGQRWLLQLYRTCVENSVAGVLGPVRSYFDQQPPAWVEQGRFFDRPEHETGFRMDWEECRTGNVLFRKSILEAIGEPFRKEFGTGGEDKDFFMRMTQAGHAFIWCNEAAAYELVPPGRWKQSFMLERALLRGRNILKHPARRYRIIATSVAAVPLYGLLLPFTLLAGQAQFMRYAIRFCDHAGRLLALVGLSPVSERKT
jgi:cellulose synthase/poly-beta-1,6-N-acetylglucosamine synthase-like glycosyltransferase